MEWNNVASRFSNHNWKLLLFFLFFFITSPPLPSDVISVLHNLHQAEKPRNPATYFFSSSHRTSVKNVVLPKIRITASPFVCLSVRLSVRPSGSCTLLLCCRSFHSSCCRLSNSASAFREGPPSRRLEARLRWLFRKWFYSFFSASVK